MELFNAYLSGFPLLTVKAYRKGNFVDLDNEEYKLPYKDSLFLKNFDDEIFDFVDSRIEGRLTFKIKQSTDKAFLLAAETIPLEIDKIQASKISPELVNLWRGNTRIAFNLIYDPVKYLFLLRQYKVIPPKQLVRKSCATLFQGTLDQIRFFLTGDVDLFPGHIFPVGTRVRCWDFEEAKFSLYPNRFVEGVIVAAPDNKRNLVLVEKDSTLMNRKEILIHPKAKFAEFATRIERI